MPVLKVIHKTNPVFAEKNGCRKYHDDDAIAAVIDYCFDPMKTEQDLIGSMAVDVRQAAFEMTRLAEAYGKNFGLRLRHWVLSFSSEEFCRMGYDYDALYAFAQYAIAYHGCQYQIVFAIHMDSKKPHIHVVMNTTSYLDGAKYAGEMADYYGYISYLRDYLWCHHKLGLTTAKDSLDRQEL